MNWKFWKKKKDAEVIIWQAEPERSVEPKKTIPDWSSSLKREDSIKNNGKDYIIIDIGYHWVVVRDVNYNTYQIQRNLLE
jgi:hypothetical protein